MNTTAISTQLPANAAEFARSRAESIPWYLWSTFLATACIASGLYWDISWHLTIGRDTFWTPAHLLIQFGAVLAGLSSAYLIFATTLSRDPQARESSVKVMWLWGPLGAFICAWGAGTMVFSAPFDNWWHNAYGLDVKIISPPHEILGFGIVGIGVGGAVLIVGQMNRAHEIIRTRLAWLLLSLGGLLFVQTMVGRLEYTDRSLMHSAVMYLLLAIGPPFVMEAFARPSGLRWARTAIATVYTVYFLLGLWVFPLFAAEPKLAPVYQHVTHMVPLWFPILMLAPALALDFLWPKLQEPQNWNVWLRSPVAAVAAVVGLPFHLLNILLTKQRQEAWNKWLQATVAGIVFVAALVAIQWPFANFLMSPAANNWVFGAQYHPYMASPEGNSVRNMFWSFEKTPAQFWGYMALALFCSIYCTRLGVVFGDWLRKMRR
jgi:hypothetical protein